MKRIISIIFLAFVATACAPAKQTPEPAPVLTPPPSQPLFSSENPGSIFDPGQASLLYEDSRARRVGDIVMVHVVENSTGKHKADTKASKDSSIELGVEQYFGKGNFRAFPLGIPSMGMSGATGTVPLVKAGSKTGLTATGETKRQSDLKAVVGVRVVKVLPNGIMQVEGAREMRINEENADPCRSRPDPSAGHRAGQYHHVQLSGQRQDRIFWTGCFGRQAAAGLADANSRQYLAVLRPRGTSGNV